MKAVISTAQGIENVKVLEVPNPPTPTGDQVQVAIKAVGINQRDIINFENYSRWNRENPIPGCDGASEVIAVGENVTKWKVSYGPFRRKSCYYYWCWSGPWRRCSAKSVVSGLAAWHHVFCCGC